MEDKYLKYVIENHKSDPKISPILDRFFTDQIDFDALTMEVSSLDVMSYRNFTKREKIKSILNK